MKRFTRLVVIILLVLMMLPITVFAAPEGYMDVELTPNNFKNYFEVVKMKHFDKFGSYDGYNFILKSKLLKNGYYLYSCEDFAIKYSAKERYKYKHKKKSYKNTVKIKNTFSYIEYDVSTNYNDNKYDFKYAKISNFKVSKVKGKIVFIEPSNVIAIDHYYDKDGEDHGQIIKLKHPYDKNTPCKTHYDENDKEVMDYYFMYFAIENRYDDGKEKIIVR